MTDAQRAQAREIAERIGAEAFREFAWEAQYLPDVAEAIILEATAALREENARLREDRNKLIEQHRQRDEQEVDGRLYEMVVAENRELTTERDTLREALERIAALKSDCDCGECAESIARAALKEPR